MVEGFLEFVISIRNDLACGGTQIEPLLWIILAHPMFILR